MTGALPPAARAIAAAFTDAVDAARAAAAADPAAADPTAADPAPAADAARGPAGDAFGEAVARLAAQDPQRVRVVLGAVVRALLEDLHPDGLDGEDLRAVLERCVRSAHGWDSEVEPEVLVVVLTGALGLSDPEDQPRPPAPELLARQAALLTADLLAAGRRPLAGYLAASFAELARAETVEMP